MTKPIFEFKLKPKSEWMGINGTTYFNKGGSRPLESYLLHECHARKWPNLERNVYMIVMALIIGSTIAAIYYGR